MQTLARGGFSLNLAVRIILQPVGNTFRVIAQHQNRGAKGSEVIQKLLQVDARCLAGQADYQKITVGHRTLIQRRHEIVEVVLFMDAKLQVAEHVVQAQPAVFITFDQGGGAAYQCMGRLLGGLLWIPLGAQGEPEGGACLLYTSPSPRDRG